MSFDMAISNNMVPSLDSEWRHPNSIINCTLIQSFTQVIDIDKYIQHLYNISIHERNQNMTTKTLNIALNESLLREIDQTVKKDMSSRSEYFRRLAMNDLERRREWQQVLDTSNQKGRKMGFTSEEQVSQILGEYKREKQSKQT